MLRCGFAALLSLLFADIAMRIVLVACALSLERVDPNFIAVNQQRSRWDSARLKEHRIAARIACSMPAR